MVVKINRALVALLGLAVGGGMASSSLAGPTPLPTLDHFKCNKLRVKAGKIARGANLATFSDQFDSHVYALKQAGLCIPADKNNSGINDPATHLFSYPIKPTDGKVTAHLNNLVTDQFGPFCYDTLVRGLRALVPAAKSLAGLPPEEVALDPPVFASHGVNHFVCYPVVATPGTTKLTFPKGTTVDVQDQFSSVPIALVVKAPKFLCVPAEKVHNGNFEIKPVQAPNDHLMCYGAKRGKDAAEPFVKTLVNTADQMVPSGTLVLMTGDELLCNPASKEVLPSAAACP